MKARAGVVVALIVSLGSFCAGGSDMLAVGGTAPGFVLAGPDGDTVRLADFADRNYVVLIFYPGDETPGCTKQLCAVRDDYAEFEKRGAKIFGVNPGDEKSHEKFINRYGFQFPLLNDEGRKTAKAYGAAGGLMIKRTVYVIDPEGKIVYAKRGMPSNAEILKAIPEKQTADPS